MTTSNESALVAELNDDLEELGRAERELAAEKHLLDEEIQQVTNKRAKRIDELTTLRESLKSEIVRKAEPHFTALVVKGQKTIRLRNGTIRKAKSKPALSFTDDKKTVLNRIRHFGWLRRFTKVERTIVADKLKAAPDCVAKLKGVELVQREDYYIKPSTHQAEILYKGAEKAIPYDPQG